MKRVCLILGQWEHAAGVTSIHCAWEDAIILHAQSVENLFTELNTFLDPIFILPG